MSSLSKVILSFILIAFFQLCLGQEENDWNKRRFISKKGWSEKADKFDNPRLVYALCKDEPSPKSKRECMIVQHKNVYDSSEKPTQCIFTLENASFGIIRIKNFGDGRAIFVWADETKKNNITLWNYRTGMIQMSSCKIVNTGLVLKATPWEYGPSGWHIFYIGILVFNDTFDVCIQKVEACGNAEDDSNCVYTYNTEGKAIGGPVTRFSPRSEEHYYMFREIISSRSSDKKYLLNVKNEGTMKISIVKPQGTSIFDTVTKTLWKFPMDRKGHDRTNFACDNDMIGMCSCGVLNDTLSCTCIQTDHDGKSKRKMDIVLKKPSNMAPVAVEMHNFRKGGFFFVSLYADKEQYFYTIAYIYVDGRVVGEPIVVAGHTRQCAPQIDSIHFNDREDGKHCITISFIEKDTLGKVLQIFTTCYTLQSFDWNFKTEKHTEL